MDGAAMDSASERGCECESGCESDSSMPGLVSSNSESPSDSSGDEPEPEPELPEPELLDPKPEPEPHVTYTCMSHVAESRTDLTRPGRSV